MSVLPTPYRTARRRELRRVGATQISRLYCLGVLRCVFVRAAHSFSTVTSCSREKEGLGKATSLLQPTKVIMRSLFSYIGHAGRLGRFSSHACVRHASERRQGEILEKHTRRQSPGTPRASPLLRGRYRWFQRLLTYFVGRFQAEEVLDHHADIREQRHHGVGVDCHGERQDDHNKSWELLRLALGVLKGSGGSCLRVCNRRRRVAWRRWHFLDRFLSKRFSCNRTKPAWPVRRESNRDELRLDPVYHEAFHVRGTWMRPALR